MVRAVLVLVLFATIYMLRDIALLILTAVIIASSIEPATRWLMRYKFPRVIAVITLFFVTISLFAGIFYFFLPPLLDDLSGFVSSVPDYLQSFSVGDSQQLTNIFGPQGVIDNLSGDSLSPKEFVNELKTTFFDFSGGIYHGVNIIFGGVLSFVLIIVISFYLAVQDKGIENFLKVVSSLKYEKYLIDLWNRTQRKIGLWMQGQLILGLLMGVFVYLGLAIMNVPYALLLGVLAALFELIPLFGPILAAVPAVAIAFTSNGPTIGLIVIGFYIIMQQFENHLIYPLVVRKVIGVPPLIVILALLVFGKLFGFLGLIIAVPAVTMFLEIADDIEKRKGAKRVKAA
ncbi:MAG: AI-2E family transporter [Desulfuromonadaceae bacterium]